MKKQSVDEYSVQIKIFKDYMLVTSQEFPEIQISAGSLRAPPSSSEAVSALSIGRAVLRGFACLKEKMTEIERVRGGEGEESGSPFKPRHAPSIRSTRFLSIGKAARLLGVSPSSIRRMISQGVLRSEMTSGGHRRFDEREIFKFLHDRKNPQTGPGD